MDSNDPTEERSCSICHSLCMDPVSLPCQHSFCRTCLERVLDIQDMCQLYYCHECHTICQVRPLIKLVRPCSSSVQINCTYCDIPAMKTCVQCESSFCATHLMKHPSSPEHILIEPTLSLEDRKCSIHKEILKYYCRQEGSLICTSCWVTGDHKGHQVILLNEFAEQKKSKLRPLIGRFETDIKEAEKKICSLQVYEKEEKRTADAISKYVTDQIESVKTELNIQQTKVLNEITKQKNLVSSSVSNQIKRLEKRKEKLSKMKKGVTELCHVKDPLTFLKNEKETNITEYYSRQYKTIYKIDEPSISQGLHKRLLQFADGLINRMLKTTFPKMKRSNIKLDKETAHYCISVKNNLRTAFSSSIRQRRGRSEERFKSRHVLSMRSFSSGNHYWEVNVGPKRCTIGVACHSMNRKTISYDSTIGLNEKSWSLCVDNVLSFYHNYAKREVPMNSNVRSFGIFLEYEAGRLSFYQLCKPIAHLHTFTTIFTEPLHAAFYLDNGSIISIRK
ncbi:E3 ubiquitin/ISG15 ligase TRIM25-like [Mantella aurantiaca]